MRIIHIIFLRWQIFRKRKKVDAARVEKHQVMKSSEKEENTAAQEESWDEGSAGAYMPTGRKYGKRRPASFSSIRFELLSSRRALSIVAENYFIIARSAGLKCSQRGPTRTRWGPEGGTDGKSGTRRMTVQRSGFYDLSISRRTKARGRLEKPMIIYRKKIPISLVNLTID